MRTEDDAIYGSNGILHSTRAKNLLTIKAHAKSNRHLSIIQYLKNDAANDISNDGYEFKILNNEEDHGSNGRIPFPLLVTARMLRLSYVEVSILFLSN